MIAGTATGVLHVAELDSDWRPDSTIRWAARAGQGLTRSPTPKKTAKG